MAMIQPGHALWKDSTHSPMKTWRSSKDSIDWKLSTGMYKTIGKSSMVQARTWYADAFEWADTARQEVSEVASTAPRYRYCVHVDEEALRSVVDRVPADLFTCVRAVFVNLISAEWDEEEARQHRDGEPEFESSDLYNLGWFKINADTLAPGAYNFFYADDMWDLVYRRPPKITKL
ncbi:Hypothetical protein D9617_10g073580 [Elsinoe fawcettii]|nr:Hypothetical protein D9617_10g073580 [Elsinoe fawcettii]